MKYISINETAEKWGLTPRVVRGYCEAGRVQGAFREGKSWKVPEDAVKPARKKRTAKNSNRLLERLTTEKESNMPGGIYHKVQIELTYNSNHIEGSTLTHEQTRHIFETNTVGIEDESLRVDDIIETVNHFRCVDYIIENAKKPLSEKMIKHLHLMLKSGTEDSRRSWFEVGGYKRFENEVGGLPTASPEEVPAKMKDLISEYNSGKAKSLEEIMEFHYRFERIHPFQDGNGRVGRLIMFKECLKNGIVPFIIEDKIKLYYYRGLSEWKNEKGFLRDTCLHAQDTFKTYLDYFGIEY